MDWQVNGRFDPRPAPRAQEIQACTPTAEGRGRCSDSGELPGDAGLQAHGLQARGVLFGSGVCDTDDALSAKSTPAGGMRHAVQGGSMKECMDPRELLQLRHELAKEREARVSAEACAKVLMHDCMLLRNQAAQAENARARADMEWRSAIHALEVKLADRGFHGFGHERTAMGEEIDQMKSALDAQDRENLKLKGELGELKRRMDVCQRDLASEKQNARRLAAVAAQREAETERLMASSFSSDGRLQSPQRADGPSQNETREDHSYESERRKSCVRMMQREIVELSEKLEEATASELALRGQAAAKLVDFENKSGQIAQLQQENITLKLEKAETDSIVSALFLNCESITTILEGSQWRVCDLRRSHTELERRNSSLAQRLSHEAQIQQKKQTHVLELEQRLRRVEAEGRAKHERFAQEASAFTKNADSAEQEIFALIVKLEQNLEVDLKTACLEIKARALDAQVAERWQREKLAVLRRQVLQPPDCGLQTRMQRLEEDNNNLSAQLSSLNGQRERGQVYSELELQGRLDDVSKCVDGVEGTFAELYQISMQEVHSKPASSACLQDLISKQEDALAKLSQTLQKIPHESIQHALQCTADLISKHENALDVLSHTMHLISLNSDARDAEQSSCLSKIELRSEEAHLACLAAADGIAKAAAEKAADEQTMVSLQDKIKAFAAFKDGLEEQVDLIARARKADQDAITRAAARIHALEGEIEESCTAATFLVEVVTCLEETMDEIENALRTVMVQTETAQSSFNSNIAILSRAVRQKEHDCARLLAGKEAHGAALIQLQIQHERLLSELEGREKYVMMMEDQQVDLHARMVLLENENRELSFHVQGHRIVNEVEHMHLEQAISKANEATHAAIEAQTQQQRLEEFNRIRTQQSEEMESRIAAMERFVSAIGVQNEKTLTRVTDLLRYRNVMAHSRNPVFVPTAGDGSRLSTVIAKNVCFLVENAGVQILSRRAALCEELVIFFSEQFDSWMQEILELSKKSSDCSAFAEKLRAENIRHRKNIAALEEERQALRHELEHSRLKHAAETEDAWKAIQDIVAVPKPLEHADVAEFKELQSKTHELTFSLEKLRGENNRLKGQIALQKAGLPTNYGKSGTQVLQFLPTRSANEGEAPNLRPGGEAEGGEVERLQEALGKVMTQNTSLLDQADMLCAMKEAADLEVKRLQEKLKSFVDEKLDEKVQYSGKAAVSLRRAFLPRTPEHRPLQYDDDDDSD